MDGAILENVMEQPLSKCPFVSGHRYTYTTKGYSFRDKTRITAVSATKL